MENGAIVRSALTIKITDFEGPLDLLLHLIKKSELDIFALPIATVTSQYLQFIQEQQSMELDVASEYLVMAAHLIHLKSIDLLPKAPQANDDDADDYQDPKEELIERLLVYHQYQAASAFFQERLTSGQQGFTRSPQRPTADQAAVQLSPGLTLVDLQLAFDRFLVRKQAQQPQRRQIQTETYTISDGLTAVRSQLKTYRIGDELALDTVFTKVDNRVQIVMIFLAVLEIAKAGEIALSQENPEAEIMMRLVKDE